MPSSDARAAGAVVAEYHEAQLRGLLKRLDQAMARFRADELDPFEVDQELIQYNRAAKELWKFCTLGNVVDTARMINEMPPVEWWERGAFRRLVVPRGERTQADPS